MTDQERIIYLESELRIYKRECLDWRRSINLNMIILLLEENEGLYEEIDQLVGEIKRQRLNCKCPGVIRYV